MALSGSFSASQRSGKETVRVDWSAAQSTANNTSTITAKLYFINQYAINIGSRTHTITINGTPHSLSSATISTTGEHYIGSVSQVVSHNSDGTKNVAMSFAFSLKATLSGTYYESISQSTTISLNTIPRTSSVSMPTATMDSATAITITRASSSFTHTLSYKFGSASGTIATKTSSTSVAWTPPLSLASQVPNATTGTGTLTCQTYSGSTLIGSKSIMIRLNVPSSVIPIIGSVTLSDFTSNYSTYGGYIQTKSLLHGEISATGSYGSTIKSYKTTVNGATYTTSWFTAALKSAGTNTISITVTDSRGRTATTSKTIDVIAYSNPSILTFLSNRCDADGNNDENGAYIKSTISTSVTPLDDLNVCNVVLSYKKSTDEDYTVSSSYTTYKVNSTATFVADVDYMYEIKLQVSDSFGNIVATNEIGTGYTLIDLKGNGRGVSFGKVSTEDGFDVNMLTRFRQDVRSEGDIVAGLGSTNQVSLFDLAGTSLKTNNNYFKIGNYVVQWSDGEVLYQVRYNDNFVYKVIPLPVKMLNSDYTILISLSASVSNPAYFDATAMYGSVSTSAFHARAHSKSGGFTTANFPSKAIGFRWLVVGRIGAVGALSVTLTVNGSTENQTVVAGTPLTLAASAIGGEGDYTYTYKAHDGLVMLSLSRDTTDTTCTTTAETSGTMKYVVIVKDRIGNTVDSNVVTVVVT